MSALFQGILFFVPWVIRRRLLSYFFNFDISESSKIGFSIITAKKVKLSTASKIGHMNIIRNLDELYLDDHATIGSMNWITGAAEIKGSFESEQNRKSSLLIGKHAAITHQHLIDCTNTIKIGSFTTVAGYRSQFITHGINTYSNTQESDGITIGSHCLIGTGAIILKGTTISNQSIVAAGSVVAKSFPQDGQFIAGVPAKNRDDIIISGKYFTRTTGHVD